ncbi:MAG TPA: hypothetical protein VE818_01760 [Nitrososphaeraceae archaeon]|jgi:hypothetical protein|nr:hypothetical protein [Nitrososphaeraceae archaeon]
MGGITKKVKEKLKGSKDKVMDTKDKAKDKVTSTKENVSSSSSSSSYGKQEREFEEGRAGTEVGRKEDPLTSYREKEPMTPAKIKEHEPTAVKREMTEKIVEPGQEATNPEEAKEKARKSGMAKGTSGAAETGNKSEQGAAGTNE